MSRKEDARFEEWLKATRDKLSPGAQRNLDALAEDETSREVFRGYLREDEFYRNLQGVKDTEKKLGAEKESLQQEIAKFERQRTEWRNWYQSEKPKNETLTSENSTLKKEIDLLKAKLGRPADHDDDGDTSPRRNLEMNDDLKAELAQLRQELTATKGRVENIDGNIPGFTAGVAKAVQRAMKEGFDVDADQIVDLSIRTGANPEQAYYQLTFEQRAKREQEQREKDIKDAEERGRRKALTERPSPDHLRASGPSVVEQLRGKNSDFPTGRRDIVNAAVDEFRRLQAESQGT